MIPLTRGFWMAEWEELTRAVLLLLTDDDEVDEDRCGPRTAAGDTGLLGAVRTVAGEGTEACLRGS